MAQATAGVTRGLAISRGRFRRYVWRAIETLPPDFRAAADNLSVVVERWPAAADYRANGLRRGEVLFGIYRGVPLSERAAYQLAAPDVIALFRCPLTRYCRSRKRLVEEVRRTLVHEYGHYFGLDEAAVGHV